MTGERFPKVTRRAVLKVLAGAGAALLGSAGGLLVLRGHAPGVSGLRCLSDHQYRTLAALALTLFPEGGAFPIGAAGMDLARAFDGYLADQPDDERSDVKNALGLFEFGPVAYERRLVTFSNMPYAERLAHFDAWSASDDLVRRQIATGLRRFMCLVFYDHAEVWPHIGYRGIS
jgi:hypothetical protein